MMYLAPSPSIASSARRVAPAALVSESRVMYLIVWPWAFIPSSSSAIFIHRSRLGPMSANAAVMGQRPSIRTSRVCAGRDAGTSVSAAAPAAPAVSFKKPRRVTSAMGHLPVGVAWRMVARRARVCFRAGETFVNLVLGFTNGGRHRLQDVQPILVAGAVDR